MYQLLHIFIQESSVSAIAEQVVPILCKEAEVAESMYKNALVLLSDAMTKNTKEIKTEIKLVNVYPIMESM
jgi:hypothetical protein